MQYECFNEMPKSCLRILRMVPYSMLWGFYVHRKGILRFELIYMLGFLFGNYQ